MAVMTVMVKAENVMLMIVMLVLTEMKRVVTVSPRLKQSCEKAAQSWQMRARNDDHNKYSVCRVRTDDD